MINVTTMTLMNSTPAQTQQQPASSRLTDLNRNVAAVSESMIRAIFKATRGRPVISFAGGHPAGELFDTDGMAAAFAHVMATDGEHAMQYGPSEGEPAMLEAAIGRTRDFGLSTRHEQLIITSGSQQGLGLLGQTLFNPGDTVLVENPTYMSALQAFGLQGVNYQPVVTDEYGAVPAALQQAITDHRPKAIYLIPTFQNPTGITMPAERRKEIADVVAANDVFLIEDDPYSELRYTDQVLSPIVSDARLDDRAFLVNTLSKVLSPGLRVGWVRGPEEVIERMVVAKQGSCMQSSTIDQLAAARYLEVTDLEEKLAPVRAEYSRRMNAMVDGLAAVLPAGTEVNRPAGGMFAWARLPEGYDAYAHIPAAIEEGVIFVPGEAFYALEPDRRTFRVSAVSNPVEEIERGVQMLGRAFKK